MLPRYEWPSTLSDIIESTLVNHFGLDLRKDRKRISEFIYRLSCYYKDHPTASTPWHETWAQVAQLVYFLPLNYLRFSAAMDQLPCHFCWDDDFVFDFGAGLSPVYWYLRDRGCALSNRFWALDARNEARDLMRAMGFPARSYHIAQKEEDILRLADRSVSEGARTLVLSFSLTENNLELLKKLMALFSRVLIIEPGLQKDARALMALRHECLQSGWQVLAPCVHQKSCPLLKWSSRDWCHFQITPVLPDWFLELIDELPLNSDEHLAYSFLAIEKMGGMNSLGQGVESGVLRVIGAPRAEKGKTIQAVCLDDERRFLVWPHRAFGKEPPTLRWGAVSALPASRYQEKGQPNHREMVIIKSL